MFSFTGTTKVEDSCCFLICGFVQSVSVCREASIEFLTSMGDCKENRKTCCFPAIVDSKCGILNRFRYKEGSQLRALAFLKAPGTVFWDSPKNGFREPPTWTPKTFVRDSIELAAPRLGSGLDQQHHDVQDGWVLGWICPPGLKGPLIR